MDINEPIGELFTHAIDAANAGRVMKLLAGYIGTFYNELLEHGVSEEQALILSQTSGIILPRRSTYCPK